MRFLGPHSAGEGPHLVPISLKFGSPSGPHFEKSGSPGLVGTVCYVIREALASISMCIACWGYTLEVADRTDTSHKVRMRTWQEVAASRSHRSAGRQKRRTTAGSHTNGCMVEYSAEIYLSLLIVIPTHIWP